MMRENATGREHASILVRARAAEWTARLRPHQVLEALVMLAFGQDIGAGD